jgi:hypothetical protein
MLAAYLCLMQIHFEFLQVEPTLAFVGIEIVKEVVRGESKRMKFQIRSEENGGRSLLIDHIRQEDSSAKKKKKEKENDPGLSPYRSI